MSKRKQHFREFKVKLALKRQGGRLGVGKPVLRESNVDQPMKTGAAGWRARCF